MRLLQQLFVILCIVWCGISYGQSLGQCSSISQYGITWTFDRPYSCGLFANGDYWIVGPATIVSCTPEYKLFDYWEYTETKTKETALKLINGWQVNPSPVGNQGFDENIETFDGSLVPSLPYHALPGESIVKAISGTDVSLRDERYTSTKGVIGKNRLETAAVLTVLNAVPPNGGATVFRPPYVGSEKPLYSTTDLRSDLLPSLAAVQNTPSIDSIYEKFRRVQLDHFIGTGSGVPGSFLRPRLNMESTYQPNNASRNADGALRLMLNDSLATKKPALVAYVQYGIDVFHFIKNGQRWAAGFGVQPGSKLPLAFAATMLGREEMKSVVKSSTFFTEEQFLAPGRSGLGTWGPTAAENTYWNWIIAGKGTNFEYADPYGYIDGGSNAEQRKGPYQFCCISQPFKGSALAAILMPELRNTWGQPHFISYADRWVTKGVQTQPDLCAPAEGVWSGGSAAGQRCTTAQDKSIIDDVKCIVDPSKLGVTYGPAPSSGGKCHVGRACECIRDRDPSDGIGRFPANDSVDADGGSYRSPFIDALWRSYRAQAAMPPPVIQPAGGEVNGVLDVTMNSDTYGSMIRYTTDGSVPNETSMIYAAPIRLTGASKLRARTFHSSYRASDQISEATYTYVKDVVAPEISLVIALADPSKLYIQFSEAVTKASAEVTKNYVIGGISITSSQLLQDERTVVLTVQPMAEGSHYAILVNAVADLSGNIIAPQTRREFTYANFDPMLDLQGMWSFNFDTGTVALDSSPKKYHGATDGTAWIAGYHGQGISFNTDSRVLIGDGNTTFGIDPTNTFSISLWIKVSGHNSAADEIFGRGGRPISLLLRSDGKISSLVNNGSSKVSTGIVPSGSWTHVALTYGPNGRTLYINGDRDVGGSELTTAANLYFPNTYSTYIGNGFYGALDEVYLYNRELSSIEVRALKELSDLPNIPPSTYLSKNPGPPIKLRVQ